MITKSLVRNCSRLKRVTCNIYCVRLVIICYEIRVIIVVYLFISEFDPFYILTVGTEGYCCTWSHTHTHTHTQTHTHTLTHTQTLTHTHSDTHTHSHTHSHTQTLTHTLRHTLTHTHSHAHSLTHNLTHTHTHTHSHTHSHSHSHTYTIRRTPSDEASARRRDLSLHNKQH